MKRRLKREFYNRPTLRVTRDLLGKHLVMQGDGFRVSGKIVETEAYIGFSDPASHAHKGMTPRNRVMFGDPGHAYVYLTYGILHCLNFVTEKSGYPAAVLIRALEPFEGIELMKEKRGRDKLADLASGPGKLCQALDIDKRLNGADLCGNLLYVEDRGEVVKQVARSSRIGIREGREKKWRFFVEGNEYVSR